MWLAIAWAHKIWEDLLMQCHITYRNVNNDSNFAMQINSVNVIPYIAIV